MRKPVIAIFLAVSCSLFAQAPAPKDLAQNLGFTYDLAPDWTVVEAKPSSRVVDTQPAQAPATEELKKGTACIQVALTAMRGSPSSVIVVIALPFDCYGQVMADQDLEGFGSGAADSLKEDFDLTDPVFGVYSLGTHRLWIERAKGNMKGHPETQSTVEIACSILQRGAVCWMTMAAEEAALRAFERGRVTLDGETATPLVPSNAFDKAPS
ncbi:MAG TPA: hypothetical protein VGG26_05585 [Terracidiphilus sp.]|jgi:hypothetical protein